MDGKFWKPLTNFKGATRYDKVPLSTFIPNCKTYKICNYKAKFVYVCLVIIYADRQIRDCLIAKIKNFMKLFCLFIRRGQKSRDSIPLGLPFNASDVVAELCIINTLRRYIGLFDLQHKRFAIWPTAPVMMRKRCPTLQLTLRVAPFLLSALLTITYD